MAINIGTNTDGDVTYQNPPVNRTLFPNITEYSTPEEIQAFVDAWLEAHPEATTTVQDGSILPVKLDSSNSATDGYVLSYNATAGKFEWYDVGGELDDINSDITDLKQDLNASKYISGSNLFDKDSTDNADGTWINSLGNIDTGSSNYGLSGYIPVTGGLPYTYKSRQGGTCNAWYDINKVKISTTNNNASAVTTNVAPDNACYIRVTYGIAEKGATQLNQSETLLPYEAYEEYTVEQELRKLTKMNPDEYATQTEFDHFFDGGNLVDATKNVSGYYVVTSTGELNANASYFTTDYLEVNEGDKIVFSESVRTLCGFLANKTVEASAGGEYLASYTVPANVKYIRVSVYIDFINSFCAYPSDSWDGFKPYGINPINDSFDSLVGKCISSLGENGFTSRFDLAGSTTKEFTNDFPWYNKVGDCIAFKGHFSEFSALWVGKGYYRDYGAWVEINSTNVSIKRYLGSVTNVQTWEHGLTITDFIYVIINTNDMLEVQITIATKGGSYTITPTRSYDFLSIPFVRSGNAMTDCTFSITNEYFKSPLWVFGDSYWGFPTDRIYGALRQLGYPKAYINNRPGQNSQEAYNDFAKAVLFGKPKYLVWCLGLNDGSLDVYKKYLTLVATACANNGTELIVAKVPSVPNRDMSSRHTYIDNMGFRYVDLNGAVGATSSGVWYEGMLSDDNTHPTDLGAKMMSLQMFVDVPEIANYGKLG